ncbi:MAG TPA: class I adenylate-forming enzyme family protein [Polyangiaceae bacterium]
MTLSIFDAANAAPDQLALASGTTRLTFRELAARVDRRRAELEDAGLLDPGGRTPVAVLATPTLASVETLFALLAAGTPALLLHSRASDGERAELVRRAGARLETQRYGRELPAPGFDPERIAAIVPTSGTTGSPRLAQLSHRALLAAAAASAAHLGVQSDRWLVTLPLAHVGGLLIVVRSLVARTAVVLFDPGGPLLSNLAALAATVRDAEVTLLSLVPTVLDRLLAHDFRPPPSLRAVLVGGAACPRSLLERACARRVPVLTTYGLTETAAQVATRRYEARWDPPPSSELVPAGVPLPNVEVRTVDGVVEVRGPSLFSGYAGEPGSDPAGGWFRTQDRGILTPSGELAINGRVSDVIITGGENVDPSEVEAALASLPGVSAACVLGLPDPTFGEIVAALLVTTGGSHELAALSAALRPRLASFKLPRKVLVVPELPLLPSGKLDRRAVRERYAGRHFS